MTQSVIVSVNTETEIVPVECGSCGIIFGLGAAFRKKRLADGKSFHCPNGDYIAWSDTTVDKLKRRLESAEANATHYRDQAEAAERSKAAYKGQVTKIKRRVGRGVCPCCKRTFADLQRHMLGQHPDYHKSEATDD